MITDNLRFCLLVAAVYNDLFKYKRNRQKRAASPSD